MGTRFWGAPRKKSAASAELYCLPSGGRCAGPRRPRRRPILKLAFSSYFLFFLLLFFFFLSFPFFPLFSFFPSFPFFPSSPLFSSLFPLSPCFRGWFFALFWRRRAPRPPCFFLFRDTERFFFSTNVTILSTRVVSEMTSQISSFFPKRPSGLILGVLLPSLSLFFSFFLLSPSSFPVFLFSLFSQFPRSLLYCECWRSHISPSGDPSCHDANEAREIRTPNLLIWSQTRCRCAIAPCFEMHRSPLTACRREAQDAMLFFGPRAVTLLDNAGQQWPQKQ